MVTPLSLIAWQDFWTHQVVDFLDILNVCHSSWDHQRSLGDGSCNFFHHNHICDVTRTNFDERNSKLVQEINRNLESSKESTLREGFPEGHFRGTVFSQKNLGKEASRMFGTIHFPVPTQLGALKQGPCICSVFKAFNLTYLHVLRS